MDVMGVLGVMGVSNAGRGAGSWTARRTGNFLKALAAGSYRDMTVA